MFDKPLFHTLTFQLWKCVEDALTKQTIPSFSSAQSKEELQVKEVEEEEDDDERMTQIRASIGTQVVNALSASSLASVLSSLLVL